MLMTNWPCLKWEFVSDDVEMPIPNMIVLWLCGSKKRENLATADWGGLLYVRATAPVLYK